MAKLTKIAVNFRMAKPNGPRCGTCDWFDASTGTCGLVRGAIRKGDLCDRYQAQTQSK